ncbi:4Fe-4S binding protein [Thermospira aquatica]|uniref:4Fe-4S binding protein n=1 Tax=Thermospira aquatica TaxID=2828656 RepID=A0AAX3BAU8_9SPIR|nr:4Fe-4S binding protein [Thermospira aquatica]URA09368.1 4Fe-4S binding protein [Thermospira aquatica]
MKKPHSVQIFRLFSLGFFLALVTILTVLHQKLPGFPSVDALCPFGGLEGLYKLVAENAILQKIQPSSFVLLGATIILALVAGRFFCGWICALGVLQGIFGWLGKKLLKKRFIMPKVIDRPLRWLKYIALFGILYFTWKAGTLIIRPYDPFAAYGHLAAGFSELWEEFAIGLIILIVSLGLSFFYERFFCKYLCPLGAFLALVSRLSPFRIRRDNQTCIHCSLCTKTCPMNIDVEHTANITSLECINCQECVTICPTKKSTLSNTWWRKKLSPFTIALIGLGISITLVSVAALTGQARFSDIPLSEKAKTASLSPDDIKGSTTLGEVLESFHLEKQDFYQALQLSETKIPLETRIKDIGTLAGITNWETETVREVVRNLLSKATNSQQIETLPQKQPSSGQTPSSSSKTEGPSSQTEGFFLEGTMTIQEIANSLKLSPEEVIKRLGLPKDIPIDKPLRDMKDTYGYTIPGLREKLR